MGAWGEISRRGREQKGCMGIDSFNWFGRGSLIQREIFFGDEWYYARNHVCHISAQISF